MVKKGDKTIYTFINNDEKECLTTLVTCSAAGELAPPMIVYSYKRIPKQIVDKVPNNWGIGRSDNGWMTGETFFEYIANIFHPWLISNKVKLPVILFLDGHTSHLTMAVSEFCSKNGIILISFFPNSTHILQPLDVAVFRPLKMEWKKAVHNFRMTTSGKKLTREDFAPILQITIGNMKNFRDIIQHGFKTCGLVPFEPDNINFSKFFKSGLSSSVVTIYNDKQNEDADCNGFLNFLEKEIKEKIDLFKSSGEIWEGPVQDTSLFNLWRSLKMRQDKNIVPHITADYLGSMLEEKENAEENRLVTDEIDITNLIDCDNLNFPLVIDVPKPTNEYSYDAEIHADFSCKLSTLKNKEQHESNDFIHNNDIDAPNEDYNKNQRAETGTSLENQNNINIITSDKICSSTNTKELTIETVTTTGIQEKRKEQSNDDLPNIENEMNQNENMISSTGEQPNMTATLTNIKEIQKQNKDSVTEQQEQIIDDITRTESVQKENRSPNMTEEATIIPSPFKKSLFWPESNPSIPKRRIREKVPSVASSKQWQDYYKKKEDTKNKELAKKEKNKEERKRRQLEKEKLQQKKKNKIETNVKLCSDENSSDNDTLGDIQTQAHNGEHSFSVGDYILVRFNEQILPGKIINTRNANEECEYEILHMEKRGLNWIWPEKNDILWYSAEELLRTIKKPELKNKRGLYCVDELSDFL